MNERMTVYPYSHMWTYREGVTLKHNAYNEIYPGKSCTFITHQNCVLNAKRSPHISVAVQTDKYVDMEYMIAVKIIISTLGRRLNITLEHGKP